jgi:hypothetical protein
VGKIHLGNPFRKQMTPKEMSSPASVTRQSQGFYLEICTRDLHPGHQTRQPLSPRRRTKPTTSTCRGRTSMSAKNQSKPLMHTPTPHMTPLRTGKLLRTTPPKRSCFRHAEQLVRTTTTNHPMHHTRYGHVIAQVHGSGRRERDTSRPQNTTMPPRHHRRMNCRASSLPLPDAPPCLNQTAASSGHLGNITAHAGSGSGRIRVSLRTAREWATWHQYWVAWLTFHVVSL